MTKKRISASVHTTKLLKIKVPIGDVLDESSTVIHTRLADDVTAFQFRNSCVPLK
jgi:hypothetical protein